MTLVLCDGCLRKGSAIYLTENTGFNQVAYARSYVAINLCEDCWNAVKCLLHSKRPKDLTQLETDWTERLGVDFAYSEKKI